MGRSRNQKEKEKENENENFSFWSQDIYSKKEREKVEYMSQISPKSQSCIFTRGECE